jgi:hypothetical protein
MPFPRAIGQSELDVSGFSPLTPQGDKALHLGGDEPDIITTSHKCLLNPFSLYYSPENLYHLVKELDIQSEAEYWDPSEHRAWAAVIDMLQMDGRVVEFFKWVEERT